MEILQALLPHPKGGSRWQTISNTTHIGNGSPAREQQPHTIWISFYFDPKDAGQKRLMDSAHVGTVIQIRNAIGSKRQYFSFRWSIKPLSYKPIFKDGQPNLATIYLVAIIEGRPVYVEHRHCPSWVKPFVSHKRKTK